MARVIDNLIESFGFNMETVAIIRARDTFVRQYCASKGWSMDDCTWEQIMEIRAQDGWKNPTIGERQ